MVSLWDPRGHVIQFGIPMGLFSLPYLGIRMGPNFWLGRHTPTHFQRMAPILSVLTEWTSNGSWCKGIKGEMSGTVCVTFSRNICIPYKSFSVLFSNYCPQIYSRMCIWASDCLSLTDFFSNGRQQGPYSPYLCNHNLYIVRYRHSALFKYRLDRGTMAVWLKKKKKKVVQHDFNYRPH